MTENMGKDELKSRVCHWYTECNQQKILKNIIYDVLREKQALDMVLNLIKSYDPDTAMWMDRCHELEIKLAQKPKVSREDIQKLAEDIESVLDNIIPNSDAIAYSAVLVEHISSWLKSKGIKIQK